MKAEQIAPVLVLSTGRCGSTMISDIVNRHPKILSLSEFFSFIGLGAFSRKRLNGEAMWKLCSRQRRGLQALLNRDKRISEIIYPFDAPQARFSSRNVPPISVATLPHLTPRFDSLYDELEPVIRARPKEALADQYRFLFEWLCDRFGRSLWIERSGGSLLFGDSLMRLFPDARVVHIYRDGRDTAMSMNQHHAFKMTLAGVHQLQRFGIDPLNRDAIDIDAPLTPSAASRFIMGLFRQFANFDKMIQQAFDLEDYGDLWSRMVLLGQTYLSSLPSDRFLGLRYEDMLHHPHEKLRELIEFIDPGLLDEAWLDEAALIPRPNPPKYPSLDPEIQLRLTRACAPGLTALGYTT